VIPKDYGRPTGSGGGGQSKSCNAVTPFWCKKCGKTVGRKHVGFGVDVCKKCRVKK
jgi:hypothetical protein